MDRLTKLSQGEPTTRPETWTGGLRPDWPTSRGARGRREDWARRPRLHPQAIPYRGPVAENETEKLRLGGMALRNGLLIHGPTHWAAAVRDRDGGIEVGSERKPELAPSLVAKMPGLDRKSVV